MRARRPGTALHPTGEPATTAFILPLVVLSAAVFLVNLGALDGLHQNDEDLYAGITREMLARGDWVLPTYFGVPDFHKPPLLYWMMMISMRVLGTGIWSVRLPVALTAMATVMLTGWIGRRLWNSRAGLLAGALVATSLGFFQYGRVGMMDVPLTGCLLIVAWGAWLSRQGRVAGIYLGLGGAALSVLLKGPVGALIALVGWAAWALTGRCSPYRAPANRPMSRRDAHTLAAGALAAAGVVLWPLLVAQRGLGVDLFHFFVLGENLGKFQGARNPLTGMVWGFGMLLMPWLPLVVAAMWTAWRRRAWHDDGVRLLFCFSSANLVVYALPAIKWAQYLLPSLPLAALLVAWAAQQPEAERPLRYARTVVAGLFLVAIPVLLLACALFSGAATRCGLLAGALALAVGAWQALGSAPLYRVTVAGGCALVAAALLLPQVAMQRIPPDLAAVVRGRDLVACRVPPFQFANAVGRPVGSCERPEEIGRALAAGKLVILDETVVNALPRDIVSEPRDQRLLCWRKWRPIRLKDVRHAVAVGDAAVLTEPVCVWGRRR